MSTHTSEEDEEQAHRDHWYMAYQSTNTQWNTTNNDGANNGHFIANDLLYSYATQPTVVYLTSNTAYNALTSTAAPGNDRATSNNAYEVEDPVTGYEYVSSTGQLHNCHTSH